MQYLRRQASAVASATLRRAESGAWASTSSSNASSSFASIADDAFVVAVGGGGLDRLVLPSLFQNARGFASRRPKLAVLLKEDVEGLGEAGSTVFVRPGHARNALLPRGVAEILPHPRASRALRPPRAVLQQQQRESEEASSSSSSLSSSSSSSSSSTAEEEEDPASRLVAVARSLSKGAVEFVRPLVPEQSKSASSSSASSSSPLSRKIADPIDAEAFVAAVAAQKRISLDPRLVMLGGAADGGEGESNDKEKKLSALKNVIDEQGEHLVPLRMRLGGERVTVSALVGLSSSSSAASGGGGDDGGEGKKGGAKKKKGGKR